MSEVWGQEWISVAPTGTVMSANGPMNESGLKSVLLTSVMLIATGKIVALRTKKAPIGKSG
jgi:hypothetical protein